MAERTLFINGDIADDAFFESDVTADLFREELSSGKGPITLWINSNGGSCFAAASIYNMLREYPGDVTVKVDGLAASAASVIEMAGDRVYMGPVSMMMIHNPSTIAMGDHTEMEKAAAMLDEVKESIINVYEMRTGLPRKELAKMMEKEKWISAKEALDLGFIDGILFQDSGHPPEKSPGSIEDHMEKDSGDDDDSILFSIAAKAPDVPYGRSCDTLNGRLQMLKDALQIEVR